MSNEITAYFKGRAGVSESLYQYDYGMVLNFDGIELPSSFECYFDTTGSDEAIPAIGTDGRVAIPNDCLSRPGDVTLHIPLHSGVNDSQVEYVVKFRVIGRARPVDGGTPEQQTAIEQALALLQNPITNIEQIVNEALDFTGDTFDEMQAKLDADQVEFEDEMQAKQTEFESEINSDFEQLNSQFNNLATNVKANSVKTLWTGTLKAKNDSATLSESVANFDYIDIYTGSTDNRCVRKKVSDLSSVVKIQGQNLYDMSGSYGLAESEIHLSISGTTATIVKTINFSWNGEAGQAADSSADAYDVECPIIRIDGVKIGSHESAELTDIRVGADGITDTTAGASVRRQFSGLKSDLNATLDSLVGEVKPSTAGSSQYYRKIPLLTKGKTYIIGVTVQTSGTYTVKIGTEESAGTMVATLFDSESFTANVPKYFIGYTASVALIQYLRLSVNTVTWDATVAEIVNVDELSNKFENLSNIANSELLENSYTDRTSVALNIQTDGYYNTNGVFVSEEGRAYAKVDVTEGDTYLLNTFIRPTAIPAVIYLAGSMPMYYEKRGTGTDETIMDYLITIPAGCTKIIIQSANGDIPPTLESVTVVPVSQFYTKQESDTRYLIKGQGALTAYGIKWSLSDDDDLGERCFGADGLNASIGIGATDGYSDFDNIYPWSEIKRCNIKVNSNGAYVVTYEGETGFSLDGSNGDVFVRIPKFSILRYKENGYEYRVVGVPNAPTHEAFIENGKELDEIFISAFEGYVDADSKLYSKSGVIPTSNITPTDFLTSAQAKGEKYSLYDSRCVDAIWTLMAVEYGTRNTNSVLGFGLGAFLQPLDNSSLKVREASASTNSVKILKMSADDKLMLPVGSNITICNGSQTNIIAQRKIVSIVDGETYTTITFDGTPVSVNTDCFVGSSALHTNFCENTSSGALSWHTGKANWSQNYPTAQNPIRYRWIENPLGNLWHFLPDVTFVNGQMYVCKNMLDYEFFKHDGSVYQAIGNVFAGNSDNGIKANIRNANYWITSLADETFAKSVLFGRSYDKSLLAQQAFGAYYYLYDDQTVCIANGGGFDHLYRCNMLTNRAWITAGEKWYLYGARLMFKNV